MKITRIASASLLLVVADLLGIVGGSAVAYSILGTPNQVWLQLPFAFLLTPGCYLGAVAAIRRLLSPMFVVATWTETWLSVAASFLWAPVVFVPLHYLTQGYLTSIGNILALACYQSVVNLPTVALASVFWKAIDKRKQAQRR